VSTPSGTTRESGPRLRPLVTIGLPTYQRTAKLRRAIESVLAQDYEPLELIISDNASTDGTRELCEEYVSQHAWMRYVRRSENVGPTRNFEGLRPLARGDYFLFLGDDDWLDPGYVSACVAALEAEPGFALVAGRAIYHGPQGQTADPHPVQLEDRRSRRRVLTYCRQVRANGVFYGVMPVDAERAARPLRNVQGGDMLHVMALGYLGRVRTLDDVAVHRSVDGMTVSLANVAATLGLGWFQANLPQLAIVYWVVRDIAFDSPVYAKLGRLGRLTLAAQAGGIVFFRFVPAAVAKFARLRMKGWRRRLGRRASAGARPARSGADGEG